MTANGYGVSLGDNENVLNKDNDHDYTTANILENIESYTYMDEFYGVCIISQKVVFKSSSI